MLWSLLKGGWQSPSKPSSQEVSSQRARNTKCSDFSRETNPVCEQHSYPGPRRLSLLIYCSLNTMDKYFSKNIFHNLGLRFLVRLCTDIGLKEVQEYATKLKRLEKMKEIREQVCHVSRKLLSVLKMSAFCSSAE